MTTLEDFARVPADPALARALAVWLPAQRWFAGKARELAAAEVVDAAILRAEGGEVVDLVVEARFDEGEPERYQVPLALVPDAGAGTGAVAKTDAGDLVDASRDPDACRVIARIVLDGTDVRSATGATFDASRTGAAGALPLADVRPLSAEQSNTSVVLDGTAILKLFRKLEVGENPDIEVTRALTDAGFDAAPAQRGALYRRGPGADEVIALAVVADFVRDAREGWDLATSEVRELVAGSAGHGLRARLEDLGAAVGRMHGALARAFGSRPATAEDAAAWVAAMGAQLDAVLSTASRAAPDVADLLLEQRADLRARFAAVRELAELGVLTRTHGDLHLGQVLIDPGGRWQILDFEGEPARPLAERRALAPPLRDVAGLVRSLDYAAAVGGGDAAHVPDVAARWRDDCRARVLAGYEGAARDAGILPPPAALAALLDAFELDKAVYELGYELANRPDWVPVPVGGILRVLDSARAGTPTT